MRSIDAAKVQQQKEEVIKKVIHDFGVENLRWPTEKEIKQFYSNGVPGWEASAQWIDLRFGPKKEWGELIFPEGLPAGFVTNNHAKRKVTASKNLEPLKSKEESKKEVLKEDLRESFKKAIEEVNCQKEGGEIMPLELNNGEIIDFQEKDKKYILARLLVEAEDALGHTLSYKDATKYSRMPKSTNLYAIHFGSFERACEESRDLVERRDHPERYQVKNRLSAAERAWRSKEFQAEQIRQSAEKSKKEWRKGKMEEKKREEIMDRLLELTRMRNGDTTWITEDNIKRDSILVYAEVIKAFGSVKQTKQAVRDRLIRKTSPKAQSPEPKKEPPKKEPSQQGRRKNKTDEELFNEALNKSLELGRVVFDREINEDPNMDSCSTYYRRIPGYKKRIKAELAKREATSAKEGKPKKAAAILPATDESQQEKEADSAIVFSPQLGDTQEIPIRVLVPKGVKGTIQITLNF